MTQPHLGDSSPTSTVPRHSVITSKRPREIVLLRGSGCICFDLKLKLGLETFNAKFRENVLHKDIPETNPAVIACHFDEANLLVGLPGQTLDSMEHDIELGLTHFERVCVNVMCPNTASLQPDPQVVQAFTEALLPRYQDDERIDILVQNTDFGVGA